MANAQGNRKSRDVTRWHTYINTFKRSRTQHRCQLHCLGTKRCIPGIQQKYVEKCWYISIQEQSLLIWLLRQPLSWKQLVCSPLVGQLHSMSPLHRKGSLPHPPRIQPPVCQYHLQVYQKFKRKNTPERHEDVNQDDPRRLQNVKTILANPRCFKLKIGPQEL